MMGRHRKRPRIGSAQQWRSVAFGERASRALPRPRGIGRMAVDLALMLQPWRLFKINSATERVKQLLQQFFAIELQGGPFGGKPMPVSAFEDPYVFAYMMEVAMSVADDVTKGLTVMDKARVARGAVIALSGMGVQRYTDVNETITRRKEEF